MRGFRLRKKERLITKIILKPYGDFYLILKGIDFYLQ